MFTFFIIFHALEFKIDIIYNAGIYNLHIYTVFSMLNATPALLYQFKNYLLWMPYDDADF